MSTTDSCCDPGKVSEAHGAGQKVVIAGANSYQVGESNHLIVIATDVFGYLFPNIVEVADTYAKAGFTVVIPDLFKGDWADHETFLAARDDPKRRGELFQSWMPKHTGPNLPVAIYDAVINELSKTGKINPLVKSAVVAHPSLLTPADGEAATVPVLFNCAENDQAFTPELKGTYEQIFNKKNNGSKFITYPGVSHGFAVRPDGGAEQYEQKRINEANTIEWFKAHA